MLAGNAEERYFPQYGYHCFEKERLGDYKYLLFVPTEGGVNFFIDLGLERMIGARKNDDYIAVEIKSFDESTPFYSFYEILGQFLIYKMALQEQIKPFELYVAVSNLGFKRLTKLLFSTKLSSSIN